MKVKCKDCKREFSQRKSLYVHIRNVHDREPIALKKSKVVKCDDCEAEFRRKGNMYVHIRKFHNKEPVAKKDRLVKCEECGTKFINKKHLYTHLRKFHNIEPFTKPKIQCEECDTMFYTKRNVYAHIRKFHNRDPITKKDPSEKCEECGTKFIHKKHLYAHIRKVHNREPIPLRNNEHNIDAEMETHEFSTGHSFEKWLDQNELKELSSSKKLLSSHWNSILTKKYDLILGLLNTVPDISKEDLLKVERLTDYSLSVLLKQPSLT